MKKKIIGLLIITLFTSLITPVYSKESRVEELLDKMTLKQKITQTFMMDFTTWNNSEVTSLNDELAQVIEDYDFGGIILFSSNIKDNESTYNLVHDMQKAAMLDQGIPLIISTDQEGGIVNRITTGTTLPGNMAIGATGDTSYAKLTGEIIGNELSALGINTTLAPVVDINSNANNPVIGLRSFGDDANEVGEYVSSYIKGLSKYNVIGCAKHFPGHGDTSTDSHYDLPRVDKSYEQLKDNELLPFQNAIEQGIEMIMVDHILYSKLDNTTLYSNKTGKQESRPASLSYKIITELLKEDMSFDGVVCSDAMNMAGITDTFDECQAVVEALSAGVDLICMPCSGVSSLSETARIDAIIEAVEEAIDTNYLSMDRIDDAVRRILTLKEEKGILDYNEEDTSLENALNIVGGKENKALEEEISAAGITVVENKNDLLPLSIDQNTKVLFLYPYDDEKQYILEGWKKAKESKLVLEGTAMMYCQYSNETMDNLYSFIDWADIVIITSYIANTQAMSNAYTSTGGPLKITNYCSSKQKKTIVMSIEKPYDLQLYKNADALLAAYGSTINIQAGIEVIFGLYGARGTLPLDIPVFDPSSGTYTDEIYYQRGTGISYSSLLPPSATSFTSFTGNDQGVEIRWEEVKDATFYRLYRDEKLIYEGEKTSYIDIDLDPGDQVIYRIKACNEHGESIRCKKEYIYIPSPSLTYSYQLLSNVRLSWNQIQNIDGYEITYRIGNHSHTINIEGGNYTSYTLEDLVNNNTYSISIRSYITIDGQTYYSSYSTIEDITPHTFIYF